MEAPCPANAAAPASGPPVAIPPIYSPNRVEWKFESDAQPGAVDQTAKETP
jgi:hypothetical protein